MTKQISGSKYVTLSLLYPMMHKLMVLFALPEGKDKDYYINILYSQNQLNKVDE